MHLFGFCLQSDTSAIRASSICSPRVESPFSKRGILMNNSIRSLVIVLISLSFDAKCQRRSCIDDLRNFVCHYRLVILVKICSMKHAATFWSDISRASQFSNPASLRLPASRAYRQRTRPGTASRNFAFLDQLNGVDISCSPCVICPNVAHLTFTKEHRVRR